MKNLLNNKQFPRMIVSLAVFAAYLLDQSSTFNQTLVTLVVGYWIGSSASSFAKDERIHNAHVQ